jgi:predicted dehydrogenase
MNDPIGFAIIGTGAIADVHAGAIRQNPGARLVSAYSRNPTTRSAFATRHGCHSAENLEEIVVDSSVHAVCITTPSGAHAETAVPVLEAGKAVLCEKPLEVSLEAVDQILSAAERGDGVVAGVFQMRLGRGARLLKQAIDAGRFGRLTLCSAYIKWWRAQSYYANSPWKGSWRLDGGGALMNQGIHAVDLLQWLVGLPDEVSAFFGTLAHPGMEAEDTVAATLRFPHGALGVIEAATSAFPGTDLRLEIIGDRGTAVLVNDRLVRWEFAEQFPEDDQTLASNDAAVIKGGTSDPMAMTNEGHCRLVDDLVEALREGRPPMISGAEARRAVALVLAIYEAARSGRRTRVAEERRLNSP